MNLFTNGRGVFGEYGIYDFPFQIAWKELELAGLFEFGSLQMEDVNYLQKGEKILSLLRKKKQKYGFSKDQTLELIRNDWEHTRILVMRRIGVKLENQFLETLKDGDYITSAYDLAASELKKEISPLFEIKKEERARELELVAALCKDKQAATINICIEGSDFVVPLGAAFHKSHEGGCRIMGDTMKYVDVRMFRRLVAELYLREYLLKKLRKLKSESFDTKEYLSHRVIGKFLEKACFNCETFNRDILSIYEENLIKTDAWGDLGTLILFPECKEAEISSLKISVHELNDVLKEFETDYRKLKEESRMAKELSKDHARSFQTKKNIPRKYIRAMRRSAFNEHFGYVEFDEDCDLKLTEEICREYQAFAKELGLSKYPEVSLRFRKLGNHKATGLYYYVLKCLCVDVRSPGSMAHEVGHMIDYHMNHISIKYDFQDVYDRYESLLKEYVRRNKNGDAKVLKGKTKYNLKYYLQPTEVFARCFEMYVVRIRKIDNSLCKPQGGFAYPDDECLMKLIHEFYDGILEKIKNDKGDQEKS